MYQHFSCAVCGQEIFYCHQHGCWEHLVFPKPFHEPEPHPADKAKGEGY